MKLTVLPKSLGYTGKALCEELERQNIFCEYADAEHAVFMPSPSNSCDVKKLCKALCSLPAREPIASDRSFTAALPERVMPIREAIFARSENVEIENALGRICAELCISCPPAVPPVVCGELIDERVIESLKASCATHCRVVKK